MQDSITQTKGKFLIYLLISECPAKNPKHRCALRGIRETYSNIESVAKFIEKRDDNTIEELFKTHTECLNMNMLNQQNGF